MNKTCFMFLGSSTWDTAELDNFPFLFDIIDLAEYRLEVTVLGTHQASQDLLVSYFDLRTSTMLEEHYGIVVQSVSQEIEAD